MGNKIGWDMENIECYQKSNGTWFILIGNHMGLWMSYDPTNVNAYFQLSNDNENMMLYDYAYSDKYGTSVMATQDRGTGYFYDNEHKQRNLSPNDGLRVATTRDGLHVWGLNYDGMLSHAAASGSSQTATVKKRDINNGTWWGPSMVESPYANEAAVFIAGKANLRKGTYNSSTDKIDWEVHPVDFSQLSGGSVLSGFGYSPVNPDRWYASTKDGDFFYSTDGGQNFTKTNSLPATPTGSTGAQKSNHVIKGSALDENKVFYAGIGNHFLISNDGGQTFTNHNAGLNVYRFRDFELSPDEKWIFGACATTGIWAYSVADDQWYNMDSNNVPKSDFTGVEISKTHDEIRFSTYGDGIYKFKVDGGLPDPPANGNSNGSGTPASAGITSGSTYNLVAQSSGRALRGYDPGSSPADAQGAFVTQYDLNTSWSTQKWVISEVNGDPGFYNIQVAYGSQRYLRGGGPDGMANGSKISLNDLQSWSTLQWELEEVSGEVDVYRLKNKYTGRYLRAYDPNNSANHDGNNAYVTQQDFSSNDAAMKWKISEVSGSARSANEEEEAPLDDVVLANVFEVNIYPNPASHTINLEVINAKDFEISMYDLNGRLVFRDQDVKKVPVTYFENGIYHLDILNHETRERIRSKVIIRK